MKKKREQSLTSNQWKQEMIAEENKEKLSEEFSFNFQMGCYIILKTRLNTSIYESSKYVLITYNFTLL